MSTTVRCIRTGKQGKLKGGPGKIIMPDGTEIDVIFEPHEVKFNLDGSHDASYFMRPLKDSSITLPVENVEGVEFG